MTPQPIISHERTAKREGILAFVVMASTIAGLLAFPRIFFPDLRATDPIFFYVYHGIALLVGALGTFGYAIPNMRSGGTFRFTLTEERIECYSPAASFGESYSIPISEITSLEEEPSGDSRRWYFGTADGRRIKITPNYSNPALDIIRTLEELRSDLELTRVS